MIGSHDTFTYLEPCNSIFNSGKRWWKTQCKSIEEQYKFGVRFFDIRVCLDLDKDMPWRYCWRYCHGIVNFNKYKRTLNDICLYMDVYFPEAIYRIVLEKGNSSTIDLFVTETENLCKHYPNLWRVDIKSSKIWLGAVANNNQELFKRGHKFALANTWEEPAHELHGSITTSNFYKTNLRKEAQKINGSLEFFKDHQELKNMIDSKDKLYFLDYCTNEY